MEYVYDDGLRNAGRMPCLYLAKGSEVHKFVGKPIDRVCALLVARDRKKGKWSGTSYVLDLAPGVRPLFFLSPMHRVWGDDLKSWGEAAALLGLPVTIAKQVVQAEYPRTARRLDAVESLHIQAEAGGYLSEIVVVSFGSPTNREIAEGWWESPKRAATADGDVAVEIGPGEEGWRHPVVLTPADAQVVSASHTPGMHGGYWAVEVAVRRVNAI